MSDIIRKEALQLLLSKLKWERLDSWNSSLDIWVPSPESKVVDNGKDPDGPAVYIPLRDEAPDFSHLLDRSVRDLARASLADVLEELSIAEARVSGALDEFEIKSDTPHGEGLLPWEQGAHLFEGAREILDAAARTSQRYERKFSRRASVVASNFLDACLMGQTRIGSFAVTALIPSNSWFETSNSKDPEKRRSLQGRFISQTMASSLEVAFEAFEEYSSSKEKDEEIFHWGVSQGLSFELVKGIDDVIGSSETELSVEFVPSSYNDEVNELVRQQFVFSPIHKKAIERAKSVLSQEPDPRPVSLTGEVTVLAREHDSEDSARIKLRAQLDGKQRSFSAHLSEEDYEKAVEAHSNGEFLSLTGMADKSVVTEVESVSLTGVPLAQTWGASVVESALISRTEDPALFPRKELTSRHDNR